MGNCFRLNVVCNWRKWSTRQMGIHHSVHFCSFHFISWSGLFFYAIFCFVPIVSLMVRTGWVKRNWVGSLLRCALARIPGFNWKEISFIVFLSFILYPFHNSKARCTFCVLCSSFGCIHVKFSLARIISPECWMKFQINDYHRYFSIFLLFAFKSITFRSSSW